MDTAPLVFGIGKTDTGIQHADSHRKRVGRMDKGAGQIQQTRTMPMIDNLNPVESPHDKWGSAEPDECEGIAESTLDGSSMVKRRHFLLCRLWVPLCVPILFGCSAKESLNGENSTSDPTSQMQSPPSPHAPNVEQLPPGYRRIAMNFPPQPDLRDCFQLAEHFFADLMAWPARPDDHEILVEELIGQLAKTALPGPGFNPASTGVSFILADGVQRPDAFVVGYDKGAVPEPMLRLVAMGPSAMEGLLRHLDDQRPTELVVTHEGMLGGMYMWDHLDSNPLNIGEQRVLLARVIPNASIFTTRHVVCVGDLCFVVLGQIVGRQYQTVSYYPSANIVLTCPTKSPELCRELRSIWKNDDYHQHLWKSLLTDFVTRAAPSEDRSEEMNRWFRATDLQTSAAIRLIQFFPGEGTTLVADRLDNLDVSASGTGIFGMEKREEDRLSVTRKNGVFVDNFIKSLKSVHATPEIAAALDWIRVRSDNPEIEVLFTEKTVTHGAAP